MRGAEATTRMSFRRSPRRGLAYAVEMFCRIMKRDCVSMILPQVHLRKPCYDFSFLEMFRFKQLRASCFTVCTASRVLSENFIGTFIGRSDGRCVQRAGTYSMRVDDSRLQGIPRCMTNNCNGQSLARREFKRLAHALSGQLICSLHASV